MWVCAIGGTLCKTQKSHCYAKRGRLCSWHSKYNQEIQMLANTKRSYSGDMAWTFFMLLWPMQAFWPGGPTESQGMFFPNRPLQGSLKGFQKPLQDFWLISLQGVFTGFQKPLKDLENTVSRLLRDFLVAFRYTSRTSQQLLTML